MLRDWSWALLAARPIDTTVKPHIACTPTGPIVLHSGYGWLDDAAVAFALRAA